MTIYILYHIVRDNHIPQWNYIPNPNIITRWAGPSDQFDMTIVDSMPNTDAVYATIDQVPQGSNWIYLIPNLYENSVYTNTNFHIFTHFKSVPRLMDDLLKGYGRIMFDDRREGYLYPNYIYGQIQQFFTNNGIPLNRVIFATSAINADKIFVQNSYSITPMSFQQFELESSWKAMQMPTTIPVRNIEKRFLCFNRRYRYRLHRLQLLAKIYKRGILDQFYYSMLDGVDNISVVDAAMQLQGVEPSHYNTVSVMKELESTMPMLLDTDDLKTNLAWVHTDSVKSYYERTGISVVTETLFHDGEIFFSEKTWHPMRMQHPFILLNGPGSLQQLRNQGYMTFNRWWDESYDDIVNPYDRLDAIEQLIVDIANWSVSKYAQFLHESITVCQHNLRHLATASTRISYDDQLKNLFKS